jgi:hypothetical protein
MEREANFKVNPGDDRVERHWDMMLFDVEDMNSRAGAFSAG